MAYYLTVNKFIERKIDDYTIQELKNMRDILKQYKGIPVEIKIEKAKKIKVKKKEEKNEIS